MIDLSPLRGPADLVDAIYQARREDRRDLQGHIELLLDHGEPIVREEALSLLLVKWGIGALRGKASAALRHDEDFGVRARAAIGLASVTTRHTRREDAALLESVFNEDGVRPELKQACFEALSLMAGRPTYVELDDTDSQKIHALVQEIATT